MPLFNSKLHARIRELEGQLAATQKTLHATEAAKTTAEERCAVLEKVGDNAIELIASAGVTVPVATSEGRGPADGGAPRTQAEFLAAYNRLDDPVEASAYYEKHKGLLSE